MSLVTDLAATTRVSASLMVTPNTTALQWQKELQGRQQVFWAGSASGNLGLYGDRQPFEIFLPNTHMIWMISSTCFNSNRAFELLGKCLPGGLAGLCGRMPFPECSIPQASLPQAAVAHI